MRFSLIAFDLYGTLLDVSGLAGRLEKFAGPSAATLLAAWRKEQLERTWREKEYQPFDVVTARALEKVAPHLDAKTRAAMCETWLSLPAWPDARSTLQALGKAGARRAILSNGTAAMIRSALSAAGLEVDEVRSVDEVRCYKPDPRVYALLPREKTLFVSSNAWDASGAKRNGLTVAFIDRGSPKPDHAPDLHLRSLSDLTTA
ncbi:MAG TPA: haloacid dehalogenase type II [Myxococcales bacterium]|nr:haloacid dehalogenase type II [Myxococcales bacterium]